MLALRFAVARPWLLLVPDWLVHRHAGFPSLDQRNTAAE